LSRKKAQKHKEKYRFLLSRKKAQKAQKRNTDFFCAFVPFVAD